MSKIHSRNRLVARGLDVATQGYFKSIGEMKRLYGYVEQPFVDMDDLEEFFEDEYAGRFEQMFPSHVMENTGNFSKVIFHPDAEPVLVHDALEVGVKIVTNHRVLEAAKEFHNDVEPTIFSWAEKSRVRGHRGFRFSAVSKGRVDFSTAENSYVIYKTVVLGAAAFYDHKTVSIGHVFTEKGLQEEANLLRSGLDGADVINYDDVRSATIYNKDCGRFTA